MIRCDRSNGARWFASLNRTACAQGNRLNVPTTQRGLPNLTRAPHVVALAGVTIATAVAVVCAVVVGGHGAFWTTLNLGLVLVSATAAWCAVAAAQASDDRRRWVWAAIAVGLVAWSVGSAVLPRAPRVSTTFRSPGTSPMSCSGWRPTRCW